MLLGMSMKRADFFFFFFCHYFELLWILLLGMIIVLHSGNYKLELQLVFFCLYVKTS